MNSNRQRSRLRKAFGEVIRMFVTVNILFGGLVMLFAAAMSGETFYSNLVWVFIGGVIVLVWTWGRAWIPLRLYVTGASAFLLLVLLSIAGYEIREYWVKGRFATFADAEPDLREFEPFAAESKVAALTEPSTLKLEGEVPKLDGATALYPLYAAFVRATYPGGRDEYGLHGNRVRCSKTGGAYDRLIRGETDIIFVARPSAHHLEMAAEAGVELNLTPIGREAFVFFVSTKNRVSELSVEQIRAIYAGEISNWAEVGGADRNIRAFQRPENSGSQTMLQHVMEGKPLVDPPLENRVGGMGGIIQQTANYRNFPDAIGFSFLYFVTGLIQNGDVRLLKVDGVPPTRKSIRSGEYPFTADIYAVTTGNRNPNIEPFLEWIRSSQGQGLVEKTGYTSIAN